MLNDTTLPFETIYNNTIPEPEAKQFKQKKIGKKGNSLTTHPFLNYTIAIYIFIKNFHKKKEAEEKWKPIWKKSSIYP